MPHPSIEGKAIATNSTKKRAASAKAAATGHEVEDVPAKKAKVRRFLVEPSHFDIGNEP